MVPPPGSVRVTANSRPRSAVSTTGLLVQANQRLLLRALKLAPGTGPAAESRLIALLDPALDMYAAYFSPGRPPGWTPWVSSG